MFEFDNVSLHLGGKVLLSSVTASFAAGCLSVIVGPNGAGKSTLLKLASGEIRPSDGLVRLNGVELQRLAPPELAARRAVLPQTTPVGFSYTVHEVVRLGIEARRLPAAPSP
jgi:iron complex transport system ATP-binding protein